MAQAASNNNSNNNNNNSNIDDDNSNSHIELWTVGQVLQKRWEMIDGATGLILQEMVLIQWLHRDTGAKVGVSWTQRSNVQKIELIRYFEFAQGIRESACQSDAILTAFGNGLNHNVEMVQAKIGVPPLVEPNATDQVCLTPYTFSIQKHDYSHSETRLGNDGVLWMGYGATLSQRVRERNAH